MPSCSANTDPERALLGLLDQALFTIAIGNADARGKNVGLLHVLANMTLEDLADEAATWLLDRAAARSRVLEAAQRLHDVLWRGLVDVDTPALARIGHRVEGLLAARAG